MKQAREIDPSIRSFQSALEALGVARAVSIVREQRRLGTTANQQSAEIQKNPDIIDIRKIHPDFVPDFAEAADPLPSSTSTRAELKAYLDTIRPQHSHVTLMTDGYTNSANHQDIG